MGTPAQPPKAAPVRTRKRSRVASLTKIAWPVAFCVVVLTPMVIFRQEIGGLIPRMKGIKIDVSSKIAETEFTEAVQTQIAQLDGLQRDLKAVVDAASDSQDKAIATAWVLIEKRLRRILASSHWNNGVYVDVRLGIGTLIDLGVLAKNDLQNFKIVEDEHNRILSHRTQGDKSVGVSATMTAIHILKGCILSRCKRTL